ncbi:hypothetical protein SAMN05428989_1593 [Pseudoxanthomonas sp. GM95]|uniref:response regulator n=1 Tax=Pseudoxanthomonas sp. GM95 TaxID=1881043 RepID=UPI0008B4842F|nr:response regulator [Pseudoxanthomonas sp. GM95]SEL16699.1 hypothetical protein SAMN05428989_1593 [Pseudoxanthomonas sp. GM95]
MNQPTQLLIVDDNAATRYAMRRVLERNGYVVLEAGTGGEGLQLLDDHPVQALVLDVNLPDVSGFDIVRVLRAKPSTELLPIVHVSAAAIATGDMITGLNAGADAYLIHPVDPDVLVATLRTLLRVRKAEDAQRASEARFREIFHNLTTPIAVVDATLALGERNDAFVALFGDIAKLDVSALEFHGGGASLAAMQSAIGRQFHWKGGVALTDLLMPETLWKVVPEAAAGKALLIIEDITEFKRRERNQTQALYEANSALLVETEQRRNSEAQLAQAQKMDALGKLTGGIAHDFNNLLTTITTGIEMMHRSVELKTFDRVSRFADLSLGAARRAATLTQRMLAFARRQPLSERALDLSEQVRDLQDMLQRTIGERISLDLQDCQAPVFALADSGQLDHVVINLVVNARDAMPAGGTIFLRSQYVEEDGSNDLPAGRYAMLSISDTGTGMAQDVLERVFEPFFTTKPAGTGTGLGLSMSYGFAKQSQGTLRIQSAVGQGTTVSLLLPATEPALHTDTEGGEVTPSGAGQTILVVEDIESLRDLVVQMLNESGYTCMQAARVDQAMSVLRGDSKVDLLLTDFGLPDGNGRELAERARAWRPEIRVLFMTGYMEGHTPSELQNLYGADMIAKPFGMDALLRKVADALR